ncbi:glycosyltransferase [Mesonia sp. HuA40]|uniref:glycosyltransferase n=1 Tax=Mesonia sp. HuA40 TaxID=2602761 RepID=UPI0011C7E602|nr:glycosyltransferase [Mesonia sp. HuA40]TXK71928.1 glycosyl transferase [Mesonia sp. HuA40]
MIPKIIHYCWFGKKPFPSIVEKCIVSWQEHLPEYEFKRWDESTYTLTNEFAKRAYRDKMYAFVADYVRLDVLQRMGGIYLDTDMLVLKPFDTFLNQKAFVGLESEHYISCGIIGAEPNHPYINACLNFYQQLSKKQINYKSLIIPKIFTKVYRELYAVQGDLSVAQHKDLSVFKQEYFYAYPNPKVKESYLCYKNYTTNDSFAVHLWHKSWKKESALSLMRKGRTVKALVRLFNEMRLPYSKVNKVYLRKIASAFKKNHL